MHFSDFKATWPDFQRYSVMNSQWFKYELGLLIYSISGQKYHLKIIYAFRSKSFCDKTGVCRDAQLVPSRLVWLSDMMHPHEPVQENQPWWGMYLDRLQNLTSHPLHCKDICCEFLSYRFWPQPTQADCDMLMIFNTTYEFQLEFCSNM